MGSVGMHSRDEQFGLRPAHVPGANAGLLAQDCRPHAVKAVDDNHSGGVDHDRGKRCHERGEQLRVLLVDAFGAHDRSLPQ